MLSCRQVVRLVSSSELEDATWRRRLSLRLHLLMCRHCRRYGRQLDAVARAARRLLGREDEDLSDLRQQVYRCIPDPREDDK